MASKRQASLLLTFLVVSFLSATTEVTAGESCTRADRNCRLRTDWEDVDGHRFVNLNISCFCESDETEDVYEALEEVSKSKCSYVPMTDDQKVNRSSVHITGCNITKEVFPASVMNVARRTDHLEFVLNQCPYVRLGSVTKDQRKVPRVSVSFTDSMLSGLPRGLLADAGQMDVKIERCEIPIVESKAIAKFTEEDQVNIDIVKSNISTVKQLAFDLPPSGRLSLRDSRVTTWSKNGYGGGSEVVLSGTVFGRILVDAFNLHGVTSFNMTGCNVAELSAEAVTDSDKYGSRTTPLEVGMREAVIKHNIFFGANGDAFVNLCKFESLLWENNTFLNLSDAPPRLQSDRCETKRIWDKTVVATGLNCMNCEDFANVNEQSCAFYKTAFCTACTKISDQCNKSLMPHVVENCKNSHPDVVHKLKDVCQYDPRAYKPSARSLHDLKIHSANWNAAAKTSGSSLLMIVMLVGYLGS